MLSKHFEFQTKQKNAKPDASYRLIGGDCLEVLDDMIEKGIKFDAVVTDPPYEIGLYQIEWDSSGIAFSRVLWDKIREVLKPGGFLVSFGAARKYHYMAAAIEDVGFKTYPSLIWEYPQGLPKPVNISTLFDRDNVPNREPIAYRNGSGYTSNKQKYGVHEVNVKSFKVYEKNISDEAKQYDGYYHGLNCFKPCYEPIYLGQKEITTNRVIDNIRQYGTGALNFKRLKEYRETDEWPSVIFRHSKAKSKDHNSKHPSVKPVSLMEELCLMASPEGGHILDPFSGTGTTGVAALKNGFDVTLIEQDIQWHPTIRQRLSEYHQQSPDHT